MNRIYRKFAERCMAAYLFPDGELDVPTLVMIAVNNTYVFDELHGSGTNIPEDSVLATSKDQTGVTVTNGILDLSDQNDAFDGEVITGTSAIILAARFGSNLELICYMDTWVGSLSPLQAPRGVNFHWSAQGLFKLGGAGA